MGGDVGPSPKGRPPNPRTLVNIWSQAYLQIVLVSNFRTEFEWKELHLNSAAKRRDSSAWTIRVHEDGSAARGDSVCCAVCWCVWRRPALSSRCDRLVLGRLRAGCPTRQVALRVQREDCRSIFRFWFIFISFLYLPMSRPKKYYVQYKWNFTI